jgi:hypothetical protein
MKWRAFAVVVGVATAVAVLMFAPVVYSPVELVYTEAPLLATHIPAYESPSCLLFGWGMTYKSTGPSPIIVVNESRPWTYYFGCPPTVINITGPIPR